MVLCRQSRTALVSGIACLLGSALVATQPSHSSTADESRASSGRHRRSAAGDPLRRSAPRRRMRPSPTRAGSIRLRSFPRADAHQRRACRIQEAVKEGSARRDRLLTMISRSPPAPSPAGDVTRSELLRPTRASARPSKRRTSSSCLRPQPDWRSCLKPGSSRAASATQLLGPHNGFSMNGSARPTRTTSPWTGQPRSALDPMERSSGSRTSTPSRKCRS